MRRPEIRTLPDGRRLHLQDGPIDLIVRADGAAPAVAEAYRVAAEALTGMLDALCEELEVLRAPAGSRPSPLGGEGRTSAASTMCDARSARPSGPVARRMAAAVAPFAGSTFITPMAAVAGAVAEAVLDAMVGAVALDRAFVNNGGDIALHCAHGHAFTVGLVDRPDRPSLFGRARIDAGCGVRGIATSGWRGRSFSRGIADAVTVLAGSAAAADAAATVVANAVDLPGHPAVRRAPADSIHPDSDLGPRLVTRGVGPLPASDVARALAAGAEVAEELLARGLILGAALHLQGRSVTLGGPDASPRVGHTLVPPPRPEFARHA